MGKAKDKRAPLEPMPSLAALTALAGIGAARMTPTYRPILAPVPRPPDPAKTSARREKKQARLAWLRDRAKARKEGRELAAARAAQSEKDARLRAERSEELRMICASVTAAARAIYNYTEANARTRAHKAKKANKRAGRRRIKGVGR